MRLPLAITLLSFTPLLALSQDLDLNGPYSANALTGTLEPLDAFSKRWNSLGCTDLATTNHDLWYQCCTPLRNTDSVPEECNDPVPTIQSDTELDPATSTADDTTESVALHTTFQQNPFSGLLGSSTLTEESLLATMTTDLPAAATYAAYPTEQGYRGEGGYALKGNIKAPASITWGTSTLAVTPTTYEEPTQTIPLPLPIETVHFPPQNPAPISAEIYRHRAQSAVNLGFWLVAEQYGTPRYFENCATNDTAEFNIAEGCLKEYMEDFWSTFITEADFAAMAELGINTVRLPIGYWTVGKANCHCEKTVFWQYMDKYENQWYYVLKAIEWAAKYNIGVLIDYHGAEGSQNGWDHSGVHSKRPLFLTKSDYMLRATSVLEWIATQIKDMPNVVGLQLLNEPYPDTMKVINPWYETTIDRLNPILGDDFPFYIFGNNKGREDWIRNRTEFVVMDFHLYFLWNAQVEKMTTDELISKMKSYYTPLLDSWGPNLIIGEWACTLANDETPWINYTQFCDAQMELLNRPSIAGWHYWNWKTEGSYNNTWSFLSSTGGPEGLARAHTDQRELLIPARGQSNFLVDVSISDGPAQGKVLPKRSLFGIEEPDALHIWDQGCKVALGFASVGSRLGFSKQWIKGKGLRSDSHSDEEYHRHFSRGVTDCQSS